MRTRTFTRFAVYAAAACLSETALAQVTFDPATATRPPPNVMIILDAAHHHIHLSLDWWDGAQPAKNPTEECLDHGGDACAPIWNGETDLQLMRRVLTGGWGWNARGHPLSGDEADAWVRTDGVMDAYKVRWGVTWYDGIGTRIALDPTTDNDLAQRTVIDFGLPPNDSWTRREIGVTPGVVQLNSWLPRFPTTLDACGALGNLGGAWCDVPWFADMTEGDGREARALETIADYWAPSLSPPRFMPSTAAAQAFEPAPAAPGDASLVDTDMANVLVSSASGGCRRNVTVMLMGDYSGGPYRGSQPADSASRIYNLKRSDGSLVASGFENLVFGIQLGAIGNVLGVGNNGVPGTPGLVTTAREANVGLVGTARAAFAAIFSLVLSGSYIGASPTITRYGDHLAQTSFQVLGCPAGATDRCNLGRPGHLRWLDASGVEAWDAGLLLRSRNHADRNLFTTSASGASAASDGNCGEMATCADRSARLAPVNAAFGDAGRFLRGDPDATFANGIKRGDTDGDGLVDNPYKFSDIANSRPVIVGAPSGIGEDPARWNAFLDLSIPRATPNGSLLLGTGPTRIYGDPATVATRDQVLYVGANDGFLHAFLVGKVSTAIVTNPPTYVPIGTACPLDPTGTTQLNHGYCDGAEVWAYAPRMLQPKWAALRSGRLPLVDGTPVVQEVLFTKGSADPGPLCTTLGPGCTGWEYRTVLVQCLGAGGPGCFAADVTNPFNPQLLWERSFASMVGNVLGGPPKVGTATSRPQIIRLRRIVGGTPIPYSVAVFGAGLSGRGTFIAIGLEDGAVHTTAGAPADAPLASAPACLDVDSDGFTDVCYMAGADASGWRIRVADSLFDSMSMGKLFDGRVATGNAALRSAGQVVATLDPDNQVSVFYATGNIDDAQDPSEQNYLFKIRDPNPGGALDAWNETVNAQRATGACGRVDSSVFAQAADGGSGVLSFRSREKAIFDPILANGSVLFTTYRPAANPCDPGEAFLYGVRAGSCAAGLDTDDNGSADATRVPVGSRVPTAPAVSPATRRIHVALANAAPADFAAWAPDAGVSLQSLRTADRPPQSAGCSAAGDSPTGFLSLFLLALAWRFCWRRRRAPAR